MTLASASTSSPVATSHLATRPGPSERTSVHANRGSVQSTPVNAEPPSAHAPSPPRQVPKRVDPPSPATHPETDHTLGVYYGACRTAIDCRTLGHRRARPVPRPASKNQPSRRTHATSRKSGLFSAPTPPHHPPPAGKMAFALIRAGAQKNMTQWNCWIRPRVSCRVARNDVGLNTSRGFGNSTLRWNPWRPWRRRHSAADGLRGRSWLESRRRFTRAHT